MAKMTLRAARVNVGLDQKKASKALNISNKTLCAWEAGKSFPKVDKVKDICALYNIRFDDIIFLTDKPL